MKSTIIHNEPDTFAQGSLVVGKHSGAILLSLGWKTTQRHVFSGVVVAQERSLYSAGYRDSFCKEDYDVFYGTITLEQ